MSQATTRAPRRKASKAWRPKPQPRSSSRSPGAQAERVVVDGEHRLSACPSRWRRAGLGVAMRAARYGGLAGAAGSPGLDGGRLGQQGPVLLDVPTAVWRQVQRSMTRWRPAAPMRARSSGSSRAMAILAARASLSPGGDHQRGVVVGADDLGQGAAGGGDERDAARHGLDGRQREALVERGHDGQLGLGVQLDDALLGHAGDERDDVAQAELVDAVRADGPPSFSRPMTTSSTSRSVRSLATASSR